LWVLRFKKARNPDHCYSQPTLSDLRKPLMASAQAQRRAMLQITHI